jgi:hypothetical protein
MNAAQQWARQAGGIFLTVTVVMGLTALTGILAGSVILQNQSETNQVFDDIAAGREVSDERLERARTNSLNNLQVAKAGADVIVAIDPSPDAGGVVSAYAGGVISNHADQASNPNPATQNNPLPTDVPPPGPSCDSTSRGLCTTYAACSRAGGHWHNGACYDELQDECDAEHLHLCADSNACEGAGGYWYDNGCQNTPQATCDAEHLGLCTSSAACDGAGGHWYDDQCNASPAACYTDVTQCTNATDCANAAGFWYDGRCNAEEEGCNASNLPLCADSASCTAAGGHWYSNGCHSTPDLYTCTDGSTILRELVCNGTSNCPGGDDEANCGDESSCCIATNGCPSETATSCGETCCCCPYGYRCDQSDHANGCVPSS